MFKPAFSAITAATAHSSALALTAAFAVWLNPLEAAASPAVEGTRSLSLGSVGRASAYGTSAVLTNASNMGFQPTFAVEGIYQVNIQSKTHGVGVVVMDSLNNARLSVGLGYLFMKGLPQISFFDEDRSETRKLELSRFGHEAMVAINVAVVKGWLGLGLKPKYQYTSLRYRDEVGLAHNAQDKLNAFGLDTALTANFRGWASLTAAVDNAVGSHDPAYTDDSDVELEGIPVGDDSITYDTLSDVSDYPLLVAHSLSVFPLGNPMLSLNFDGTYDFTSYRFEEYTRLTYGGSAEFIAVVVPIRLGAFWDTRGKGKQDDRVYIAGGVAYTKPAKLGGVGMDIGFGFRQAVVGPNRDTVIGFNLGIRLHPDL